MEAKAYRLQILALKHKDLCYRRRARNRHGTLDLGTNWPDSSIAVGVSDRGGTGSARDAQLHVAAGMQGLCVATVAVQVPRDLESLLVFIGCKQAGHLVVSQVHAIRPLINQHGLGRQQMQLAFENEERKETR